MNFPEIHHISDLQPKVSHLPEIRFAAQSNGFIVGCYMISGADTFSGETAVYARECRGITFDSRGNLVSRPFHKFFNIGERVETQENILDFNSIIRLTDKRDGSLITPILIDNEIVFKSKKSFESDVAVSANLFATSQKDLIRFCKFIIKHNATPIFEFTSSTNRIVINYGQESQLTLLNIRENVSGEYWTSKEINRVAEMYKIPVIEEFDSSINWPILKEKLQNETGSEGYVFQFNNGEMVKAKSKWYLELHRTVVFQTERNIAEMVLNETIDDFKSYLSQVNDNTTFDKVLEIEKKVIARLNKIQTEVEAIFEENKLLDRKTFAITLKDTNYFNLLIQKFIGKEVSYKDYFEKYILKEEYSIIQI